MIFVLVILRVQLILEHLMQVPSQIEIYQKQGIMNQQQHSQDFFAYAKAENDLSIPNTTLLELARCKVTSPIEQPYSKTNFDEGEVSRFFLIIE